ncbi:MAG TPA: OsmC family peroxiredoxin [Candidatus Acidoferrales bacterium]|nr:OsmC family peroxiredoxin [Candidatus Acidoferrales bacterium]
MTQDQLARTAEVAWTGDVAHGHGDITTASGKVSASYSFGTRFSGDPGTNPEELLAASHAACFTMATSAFLTRAGHPPTSLDTTATVYLEREGEGWKVPKIELAITGVVPGVSADEFAAFAKQAEENCPISRALAVPISLRSTLSS